MKKRLPVVVLLVLAVALFVSCATAEGQVSKKKEVKVLFIGNSFTFGNNLPYLFTRCIESAGYKVKADSVMVSSYTLEMFCDPTNPHFSEIDDYLNGTEYDYVIIQEQSIRPIEKYDKFREAVTTLVGKARANGATPLLFETWGYAEGFPDLKYRGWTTTQMEEMLLEAYEKLGNELGVDVVRCGSIFNDVYQNRPEIPMYLKDLKHPGIGGSYLVALTFFNYIYGADVRDVTYNPQSLDSEMGVFLREEVMSFFRQEN